MLRINKLDGVIRQLVKSRNNILQSVRFLCLRWLFSSRGRKIPVQLEKFIRSNPVHPVAAQRLSICPLPVRSVLVRFVG